jgi:hypothetical protein
MKRLLWLALLVPVSAHADPVSLVAAAVSAFGTAIGGVVGAGLIMYAEVVAWGIVIAGVAAIGQKAKRKARDAFNESLRDRLVTVRGAAEYRRVVLGRQRVGGVLAFWGSTGPNKEKFAMVIALASHECDGVEAVYFNDELVWPPAGVTGDLVDAAITVAPYARTERDSFSEPFFGDGAQTAFTIQHPPVAGTVTAGFNSGGGEGGQWQPFTITSVVGTLVTLSAAPASGFNIDYQADVTTSYARVRAFLGAPGQTVDAAVQATFPEKWSATHPMSGCAGLAVIFDYNEDAFPTGLPAVSAVMRGAKVYDPRLDSTAGGTGPQRTTDPTTWTWSENPALLIGYVTTSSLLGRKAWSNVNITQMAVAANVCDIEVDYLTWGNLNANGGPLTTNGSTIRVAIPRRPSGVTTI